MVVLEYELLRIRTVGVMAFAAIDLAAGQSQMLALEIGLVSIMTGQALGRHTIL